MVICGVVALHAFAVRVRSAARVVDAGNGVHRLLLPAHPGREPRRG